MSSETISHMLSEFAHNLRLKDVPDEVVSKAKLHVLDTLGIMMATCNLDDVKRVVRVCKLLGGPPESTVIGHELKLAAPNAVIANATMAHSIDYDDTHLGSIHQSCIAVPTTFAVGEKMNSFGKEVLEAVIAAYEVNSRLGLVAPMALIFRGFHPTPVIGVFGSALAAGKLMGLTVEQLNWALGIAGSMSSGISQCIREGVWVKPMHPGFASHAGIIASLLAKEGIKGPCRIFEGEAGFFTTYLKGEKLSLDETARGLGEEWETLNISFKPYPSCHGTHSAIDIALKLKNKNNIKLDDVEECTYYLSKLGVELAETRPVTPYGAKFSIPYCVALALKKGHVSLWDFAEEAVKDAEILGFLPKVKVIHDEAYDSDAYKKKNVIPARAKIKTKNGNVYEEEVIDHKGTSDNPLTRDEVIAKFKENIKSSEYKGLANEVINMVLNMEKYEVMEIMDVLQSPTWRR